MDCRTICARRFFSITFRTTRDIWFHIAFLRFIYLAYRNICWFYNRSVVNCFFMWNCFGFAWRCSKRFLVRWNWKWWKRRSLWLWGWFFFAQLCYICTAHGGRSWHSGRLFLLFSRWSHWLSFFNTCYRGTSWCGNIGLNLFCSDTGVQVFTNHLNNIMK